MASASALVMFQLDLTLVKSDTYGKIEQINLRKLCYKWPSDSSKAAQDANFNQRQHM